MSSVLRLDASIRTQGSVTRALADSLEAGLFGASAETSIVRRDIGVTPVPSTAWAGAVFGRYVSPEQQTPEQKEGIALATQLADEMIAADGYIFAVPFYNFGVSQHFKAWVDLLLTDPRFAPGAESPVKGRPAKLMVARGGGYGPGTPRHGWDHGTSWYRRMLEDVLLLDVAVVECELTLAEVTPAMESLRGQAADNLAQAHVAAKENGQDLARRISAMAVSRLESSGSLKKTA